VAAEQLFTSLHERLSSRAARRAAWALGDPPRAGRVTPRGA